MSMGPSASGSSLVRVARACLPILLVVGIATTAAPAALLFVARPAQDAPAQEPPRRRGISTPPPAAPVVAPSGEPRAPLDPAWVGGWLGAARLTMAGGAPQTELPLALVVSAEASGPSVRVWSLPAGALDAAAVEVVANGGSLAFTLDSQGERGRFELSIAEDARGVSGTLSFPGNQRRDGAAAGPSGPVSLKRVDIVSQLAESRVFSGTLNAGAQKLPMRLALGEGPNGWCGALDILVQGIRDFPVAVERTESGVIARFSAGVTATIELAATPAAAKLAEWTALEGRFSQGVFSAPIRLEAVEGVRAGALRRPQQPMPPFPYEVREAAVPHPLGHVLAGTLTVPSERALAIDGRVPALVCVSGSGPQDRDETLMGHKPFAVLADALARAGVAVLRYDDRGTAASTGAFTTATTTDLASDADMAVEWLKRQPGIDPTRVGILGHSEGGLIGPIVAKWQNEGDSPRDPLAFLVLIAPPGEIGGRILTRQTKALSEAANVPPEQLRSIIDAHTALMDQAIAGRSADVLRPAVTDLIRAQVAAGGRSEPDEATLRALVEQTLLSITNPWMSEFIRLDPRPALLWLEVPTLALWGTRDLQVDAQVNGEIFAEAAKTGGAPITTRILDGLNHLLQPSKLGTVEEYGEIELTIDPSALDEIVRWVVATARAGAPAQIPAATRAEAVRNAYVSPRLFEFREAPPAAAPALAPAVESPATEGSSALGNLPSEEQNPGEKQAP